MDRTKLYNIVGKTFELIELCAEIGEDYSLILRTHNEMIEEHQLNYPKVKWISNTEFELYD